MSEGGDGERWAGASAWGGDAPPETAATERTGDVASCGELGVGETATPSAAAAKGGGSAASAVLDAGGDERKRLFAWRSMRSNCSAGNGGTALDRGLATVMGDPGRAAPSVNAGDASPCAAREPDSGGNKGGGSLPSEFRCASIAAAGDAAGGSAPLGWTSKPGGSAAREAGDAAWASTCGVLLLVLLLVLGERATTRGAADPSGDATGAGEDAHSAKSGPVRATLGGDDCDGGGSGLRLWR